MKLVVKYNVSDECTYSCDVTTALEYESVGQFAHDFEEAAKAHMAALKEYRQRPRKTLDQIREEIANGNFRNDEVESDFTFAGVSWDPTNFSVNGKFYCPAIFELEEWWEYEINNR